MLGAILYSCVCTMAARLNAGGGSIQDCRISANKLNGMLVGDGADPALSGNDVRQNGASGLSLKVQSTLLVAANVC